MTPALDGIQLWQASLDTCNTRDYQGLQNLLDEAELARARRFYFERDQRRFTVTRGLLRLLLGRYLLLPPPSLKFACANKGKPYLTTPTGTNVRFNLSHSGGNALFAFTLGREIGVDVEVGERLGDDWPAIASRYFSTREQTELHALPEHQRRAAFLTGWARKEAYLKATGLGISEGLERIEVTLAPERPPAFLSPEIAARWTFCDLGEGGDTLPASALVVERRGGAEPAPEVRRFSVVSVAALLGHQDG